MFLDTLFGAEKSERLLDGENETLSEFVVGIMYEGRENNVPKLSLKQQIWLLRTPDNEWDSNALMVAIDKRGKHQIGFIRKELAAILSPRMDQYQSRALPATVIEISSDMLGKDFKVRVCFQIPKGWMIFDKEEVQAISPPTIEFHCDNSRKNLQFPGASSLYVVLNCSEMELSLVMDWLSTEGLLYKRSGLCYWPVDNHRSYQWYLRFDPDSHVTKEEIERFFRTTFGVIPDHERFDAINDAKTYCDLAESLLTENEELKDKTRDRENSKKRLETLEAELLEEKKISGDRLDKVLFWQNKALELQKQLDDHQDETGEPNDKLLHEASEIFRHMLPDIDFVRDSLVTLMSRIDDKGHILRLLSTINYKPETIRAEKVEATKGWRELDLNRQRQERVYYKKSSAKFQVLISLKKSQSRDIEFLKRL